MRVWLLVQLDSTVCISGILPLGTYGPKWKYHWGPTQPHPPCYKTEVCWEYEGLFSGGLQFVLFASVQSSYRRCMTSCVPQWSPLRDTEGYSPLWRPRAVQPRGGQHSKQTKEQQRTENCLHLKEQPDTPYRRAGIEWGHNLLLVEIM